MKQQGGVIGVVIGVLATGAIAGALYYFFTCPCDRTPVSYTHLTLPTICSV